MRLLHSTAHSGWAIEGMDFLIKIHMQEDKLCLPPNLIANLIATFADTLYRGWEIPQATHVSLICTPGWFGVVKWQGRVTVHVQCMVRKLCVTTLNTVHRLDNIHKLLERHNSRASMLKYRT